MPRSDVVARSLPEGSTVNVATAVLCAAIIETGCFAGLGGGGEGSVGDGGDLGAGGLQGGR